MTNARVFDDGDRSASDASMDRADWSRYPQGVTSPAHRAPIHPAFDTSITMTGPWRRPVNMLTEQSYDGHTSLHDDETAEKLGLRSGAIEGPTHFSQFEPLLATLWGQRWFSAGCISCHFQSICAEGDDARAHVTVVGSNPDRVTLTLERNDGAQILTGTASVGPDHPDSELDVRLSRMKRPAQLFILDQLAVGQRSRSTERVTMDFDQHMGDLYPFSLNQKLANITEHLSWHTAEGGTASPWGRAVIPFEMVSVLTQYSSKQDGFRVRGPAVGLFLDLEVRLIDGPLFAGQPYVLEREIVAISESRRTESYWTRTTLTDEASEQKVAEVLLHQGVFKESFAGYPRELLATGAEG